VNRAAARRFADFERLVEDVALTGFEARLARALLRLAGYVKLQRGVVTLADRAALERIAGQIKSALALRQPPL
jgi:CRP/FNR family transcriptional regulator